MERAVAKREIIEKLQNQILSLQGLKTPLDKSFPIGLGPIEPAFPNRTFPTGVIHEFLSTCAEEASATLGFISAVLGRLMEHKGPCLWISCKRTVFPPALKYFNIEPDRIIFVDLGSQKDLLWAVEEALKCDALSAVVAEIGGIGITESRRLQLAAEQSRVTGLMHCYNPNKIGNTTCVARWKITPLASGLQNGMPGVGYPNWNIELAKIRNGRPGTWQMQWAAGHLRQVPQHNGLPEIILNKTA